MNEQQLDAIKDLAERFGSSLKHTDVIHEPFDLPAGWVTVLVCRPDPPPGEPGWVPSKEVIITAGVSPEGKVHT
jgi:hypothetical protein